MDENYKVVGASAPLVFHDGTEVSIYPLTDKDIEELNEWVRYRYIRTVRNSLQEGVSDKQYEMEMRIAYQEAASLQWLSGIGAKMMASPDGMARLMYQACHKEVDYDTLHKLLFHPENLERSVSLFERLNNQPEKKGRTKKSTVKKKKRHPTKR